MKKLYLIKEPSGKWNFTLVVNGKKVLNSANQGYSRFTDCKRTARRCVNYDPSSYFSKDYEIKTTRKEFNALFKKKGRIIEIFG